MPKFISICAMIFISTTMLSAQELTMFSSFGGYQYYIDDIKIDKEEVTALMAQYPETISEWQKSNRSLTTAYVMLGAELGFGIWAIHKSQNSESLNDAAVPYIGFLATAFGSMIYSLKASKHKKNSVLLYNRRATADSYNFTPSKRGIGVCMHF